MTDRASRRKGRRRRQKKGGDREINGEEKSSSTRQGEISKETGKRERERRPTTTEHDRFLRSGEFALPGGPNSESLGMDPGWGVMRSRGRADGL
jgi:hypothetical protein